MASHFSKITQNQVVKQVEETDEPRKYCFYMRLIITRFLVTTEKKTRYKRIPYIVNLPKWQSSKNENSYAPALNSGLYSASLMQVGHNLQDFIVTCIGLPNLT